MPPSNPLETLKGDRRGQQSIRINGQFRICFLWTPEGPKAIVIVDYYQDGGYMVRIPTHRAPTHPGEMLLEEFLKPLGVTQTELAALYHAARSSTARQIDRIKPLKRAGAGRTRSRTLAAGCTKESNAKSTGASPATAPAH